MEDRDRNSLLEEALAEPRTAFVAALDDGDATAAARLYAPEAWLLPPSAPPLQGLAAIKAFWRAGLEAGIRSVELDVIGIGGDERLAYEVGRYQLRLEPNEGEDVVDRGSYLVVHALQPDGSWRRAVEMLRPDACPGCNGFATRPRNPPSR